MNEANFKENLLKFGGIDALHGTINLRGNMKMLGDGSYMSQLMVRDMIVTGNAVIPGISFDSLTIAGDVISTDGNFIGNGALVTGVISTLPSEAKIDIVGNTRGEYVNVGEITADAAMIGNSLIMGDDVHVRGHVNVLGGVIAGYFVGNGALITGVMANLPSNAAIDIAGNVNGTYAHVSDITATAGNIGCVSMTGGNVEAEYFIGNGTLLAGLTLPPLANIDIVGNTTGTYARMNEITANAGNIGRVLMTEGNVAAEYFTGNGALLTGVTADLPKKAAIDIVGNTTGTYSRVGEIKATLGNIGRVLIEEGQIEARYFIGSGARLTELPLPPIANIDIRGNVSAAYANVGTITASAGTIGNVRMAGGDVSASRYIINDKFNLGYNWPGNPTLSFTQASAISLLGNFEAEGEEMWFSMGDAGAQMVLNRQGTLRLRGKDFSQPPTYIGSSIQTNGITTTSGNVGNVVMEQGSIAAQQGNIGNVMINEGTVTAQNFVGNGALLTGINTKGKYVAVGRKTNQKIGINQSWAGRDVIFDDIRAQSNIEYYPFTGIFRLEGGVTYRITAQLGWKSNGGYSFAFMLYDWDKGVQVYQRAESLSINLDTYNASSPMLDIVVTPTTTTKYSLRIADGVTAGKDEEIRYDVGTFLTIVAIGRSDGFSSEPLKVSAHTGDTMAGIGPKWTKVANWDFGGTIVAPTPGVSAKREYSWSVTGGTLSMKGYYSANSSDGASAGDGEYVLEIPPGYTIDPSVIATSGTTEGIPVGQLTLYTASTQGTGVVLACDSTHLKFAAGIAGSGQVAAISSTFAHLNTDAYSLYFSADVPIL